jgi:hypothetical protein
MALGLIPMFVDLARGRPFSSAIFRELDAADRRLGAVTRSYVERRVGFAIPTDRICGRFFTNEPWWLR